MAYHNHGQMWLTPGDQLSVVFKVKAEANSWVLLSSQVENVDVDVYLVGIGVDNKTEIHKDLYNSTALVSEDTPHVLSASEFRYFWISWGNQLIQVN